MTEQALSSSIPYLLRAMHEWISDNGQTPLVLVDTTVVGVQVPQEHIKDGAIVLNIAWSATGDLQLGNEEISFNARFGGVARNVVVPVNALRAIYARESGQGMQFGAESETQDAGEQTADNGVAPESGDDGPRSGPGGPGLRLVK